MRFETKAIHRGQEPDKATGAVTVPVYQTSTFKQDAIGKLRGGYEYSRVGNPTRAALETAIAALENGTYGLAFSSGVAAVCAVLETLKPGDRVLACEDIYGGTYRLLEQVYRKWGLRTDYVPSEDTRAFKRALTPQTRLIWLESPTNPLLKLCDIRAIAKIARAAKVPLAVDNTFASPYLQRPLELGADIVVHSTTKYLGGHSDLVGGAVVTSRQAAYKSMKFYQKAAGAVPGPWDCWLTLRGLKTLAVRMRQHGANASAVARFLKKQPKVAHVYFPGFGGMVSLDLKGGRKAVDRFLSRLELFTLAESLGGVESLVCYPPMMTHGSLPREERLKRGITDALVRLSVGLESREDLLEDLQQALG